MATIAILLVMTVILDLDYTLLDGMALKQGMCTALAPLGVSQEQCATTYAATVAAVPNAYDYDPARHAALLAGATGVAESDLQRALQDVFADLRPYLYPDSLPFLEFLKGTGATLVLLTLGNALHQQEKVRHAGIEDYFAEFVYAEAEKHTLPLMFAGDEQEWLFINDNPAELLALAERFPRASMLRVKRANAKTFADDLEARAAALVTFPSLAAMQPTVEKLLG